MISSIPIQNKKFGNELRKRCIIPTCMTHLLQDKKFGLHRLPTNPVLNEKWQSVIRSKFGPLRIAPHSVLCSAHFSTEHKRTLAYKNVLTEDAFPTFDDLPNVCNETVDQLIDCDLLEVIEEESMTSSQFNCSVESIQDSRYDLQMISPAESIEQNENSSFLESPELGLPNNSFLRTMDGRDRVYVEKYMLMGTIMLEWVQRCQKLNIPLTDYTIRQSAQTFAKIIEINDFQFNKQWRHNFKERNKIECAVETAEVIQSAALAFHAVNIYDITKEFRLKKKFPPTLEKLYDEKYLYTESNENDLLNVGSPLTNTQINSNNSFSESDNLHKSKKIRVKQKTKVYSNITKTKNINSNSAKQHLTKALTNFQNGTKPLTSSGQIEIVPVNDKRLKENSPNNPNNRMKLLKSNGSLLIYQISKKNTQDSIEISDDEVENDANTEIFDNNTSKQNMIIANEKDIEDKIPNYKISSNALQQESLANDHNYQLQISNITSLSLQNCRTKQLGNTTKRKRTVKPMESITTYEKALEHVKLLEDFALIKCNFRAINFLNNIQEIFKQEIENNKLGS